MGYNNKYYKRHLDEFKDWENAVGENIFNTFAPESILDLGCGVGSYLEGALLAGCKDVLGIELNFDVAKPHFTEDISPFLIQGDITKELNLPHKFDIVTSFEAAEHIDPDGTDSFIDNLIHYSNDYIILTAAPPGQRGTGHINLREKKFWIKEIESRGAKLNSRLTLKAMSQWKNLGAEWYILRNLMVFKKE